MARIKRASRDDVELRQRVREARVRTFGERGAVRFAKAVGVHQATYRAYEQSRNPSVALLLRVSEVSGVELRMHSVRQRL